MDKYLNKYRINSTRLQKWNYGWAASYYITICTNHRICYFGWIDSKKIHLSKIGLIAKKCWLQIPNHSSFVELSEFVIMPNHLHGIITVKNVETRHALSLQQQQPPDLTIQQPSPIQDPRSITPGEQRFRNQGINTVSSFVGGYKSSVTRNAHLMNLEFGWQGRFWDHVIRNNDEFERIKRYIINNPVNWTDDEFFI